MGSTFSVFFSGCLRSPVDGLENRNDGSDEKSSTKYEQCDFHIIYFYTLPELAQIEVRTVLDEGTYETENKIILPQLLDINSGYLRKDDVYYSVATDIEGDKTRLSLEETFPEARPFVIRNSISDPATVDVYIKQRGNVLVNDTVKVEGKTNRELNGDSNYQYGGYEAEIEGHGFDIDASSFASQGMLRWRVKEGHPQPSLRITDKGGEIVQPIAEVPVCEWGEDGELESV
jgi:hypothetical protein